MTDINQGDFWVVDDRRSLEAFIKMMTQMYEEKKYLTLKIKGGKTRTSAQNNALHVYCRLLGEKLNDSGYDMKRVIKQEVDIPWSPSLVKEYLWKPIQKIVANEDSTAKAGSDDYYKTYSVLSRHLSDKFGVFVEFPSKRK
jgi:hypothetical protein